MPESITIFRKISLSSVGSPVLGNPGAGVGVEVMLGTDVGPGVKTGVALGVGITVGAGVGVGVALGVGVGVGVGVEDTHAGTVMVSVVVETVPPKAKALPVQVIVLPMVMPEASILVPTNVELAPSVVAAVGVQNTSQAPAPPANVILELATEVSAPPILNMYVPLPLRVMPAVPMDAAPVVQYTPGV